MGNRCKNNLKQHPHFDDTAPLQGYIMKKVLEATEVEINCNLVLWVESLLSFTRSMAAICN